MGTVLLPRRSLIYREDAETYEHDDNEEETSSEMMDVTGGLPLQTRV